MKRFTLIVTAVLTVLLALTLTACNSEKDMTAARIDAGAGGKVVGDRVEVVVEQDTAVADLSTMISTVSNAPWKLYRDAGCTEEIADKIVPGDGYVLNNGDNTYYAVVTSLDGEHTATYTVVVHKRFQVTAIVLNSEGLTIGTETVESYTKYTPEAEIAVPKGYRLEGWKADDERWAEDGLIRRQTSFAPIVSPESYTVTLSLGTDETLKDTIETEYTVIYGEQLTFPVISDATREAMSLKGYGFSGWANFYNGEAFTDPDGKMLAPWSREASLTLKALWTPVDYTITYSAGDTAVIPEENPDTYNVENVTELDIQAPITKVPGAETIYSVMITGALRASYDIYKFEGWYFDENHTEAVTEENWVGRIGNVTLYAKYEGTEEEPSVEVHHEIADYFVTAEGVRFGAFPQTLIAVTDDMTDAEKAETEEILEALKADITDFPGEGYVPPVNGLPAWYRFDDIENMWYIDTDYNGILYRGVYFTAKRSPDNQACQAEYEANVIYWFRWEPVLWIPGATTEGYTTLVSDKVLYSTELAADGALTSYSGSALDKWLNGTFLNEAFTERAEMLIPSTVVDNSESAAGYNENGDARVYILSKSEAEAIAGKEATDYAKVMGYVSTWWTRTNVNNGTETGFYAAGGDIIAAIAASDPSVGVLPVLRLNIGRADDVVEEPEEPVDPDTGTTEPETPDGGQGTDPNA